MATSQVHKYQQLVNSDESNIPVSLLDTLGPKWQQFVENLSARFEQPDNNQPNLEKIKRIFACSEFVADCCLKDPNLLFDLVQSGDLETAYTMDQLTNRLGALLDAVENETELNRCLRLFRQRELVRIAWRDLNGAADLKETLAMLSELADACISLALAKLSKWQQLALGAPIGESSGQPSQMVVLALGKLGGGELNFSSDIDLIFSYNENGETDTQNPLSNHEYFTRLGQKLIQTLSNLTADGFVFRVDMRLRPNGDSGPLALSFDAMEHYYIVHGRGWERYALIKARPVGGEAAAGDELLSILRPFVYRKYLDYGAFESIRSMKSMIDREQKRKGVVDNIKLGRGGIREIEFIAQSYQLVLGGREPSLQTPKLETAMTQLSVLQKLPEQTNRELLGAYEFLRNVEHRLQMVADQQSHTLPTDQVAQQRLAFSMGYSSWGEFQIQIDAVRSRVQHHFMHIVVTPGGETEGTAVDELNDYWLATSDDDSSAAVFQNLGYQSFADADRLLKQFRQGRLYRSLSSFGRDHLDRLMPLLIESAAETNNPNNTLSSLIRLIELIGRRAAYLALLVENPLARTQVVKLCASSPHFTNWLGQHPVLLDEFLDPINEYQVNSTAKLNREIENKLAVIDEDDIESQMDTLRKFRHGQELRVAAAHIAGLIESKEVALQLCRIAESVLEQTLNNALVGLTKKYGSPACCSEKSTWRPGFGVVAYGKLGSGELGYGSDLDLIFIYEACDGQNQGATDGSEKSISNEYFFSRLTQRIVSLISTRTATGILYEVDTRLRPSGHSGTLVTSLQAFLDYQLKQAWTWEHQALVRARVAVGDSSISTQFEQIRSQILSLKRDQAKLADDILSMRARIIEEKSKSTDQQFDLKIDSGGIV